MPVSARTFLKGHQSAWRVIGPSPLALGQSQRRLACAFHSRRNSARTGSGSGTERSLLPLPTTRISPFLPSIEVTSRVAASLMRRPQAYISRNAILATGCRTLPTTARASASERTPGRRLRFGALTFFLRTAPSRSRACVCRETGCQHDRAGTSLARRPARRADAKSSCAPPSRRDRRASGDSGRQGRERRGCRRPGYSARGRPRPCRRSYAYAGVSSRWSFWQVDRHMPAPRDYPTRPSHDLTASAIYGEAVQSNYDNVPGHIIVEQYPRQSAPAREGLDVAAQEVLEALAQEKAQKYLPGEAQHHNEGHQRTAGAPDREMAKMSPIDLGLLTGQGAQAQIGLGLGARAVASDDMAEVIGTTAIAALADHGVKPAGSQRWELLECRKNERQIGVDTRGPGATNARQAGPG